MKTSSTTSLWSWALLACLWILSVTVTATEGDYLRPQPPHSRQLQSPSRIVNSKDFKTCQEAVFNHIASCTNNNFMFVTTLGDANTSFSTEFLYYYVRTIWLTFFSNRRMIFLRTKRHWQYDCPEQLGWFCYFTKHSYCPDTVTEVKDMDISHPRNSRDKWGVPGPKMIDRNQIADIYYHPSGQTIAFHMLLGVYKPMFNNLTMSYFNQTSLMTSQVGACSIQKDDWIQFHDIIGMMVKYAFQLNPHTLLKVNQINKVYASLWKTSSTRFASLCLRSQDEFAQHGNNNLQREDQLILFNSSLVVKHFLTSLQNHTVSNRGKQLSPIQDVYICKLALSLLFVVNCCIY